MKSIRTTLLPRVAAFAVIFLWSLAGHAAGDEKAALAATVSEALISGDYQTAVEDGEALVAILRGEDRFGDTHLSILSLQNLAFAYGKTGSTQKADALFLEALEFSKTFDGRGGKPAQEAIALLKLANHLTETSRYAEAEKRFEQALKIQTAAHGAEHPLVGEVLGSLGVCLERCGKFPQALEALGKAYEIDSSTAKNSPAAIDSLWNLGYTEFRAGMNQSALDRLEQFVALSKDTQGRPTGKAIEATELRARILRDTGQIDAAAAEYARGLEAARAVLGEQSLTFAKLLRGSASVSTRQSDLKQAESALARAIAIYESNDRGDDPEAISMRTDLAGVFQNSGRLREAVPLLESVLESLRASLPLDQKRLANAYAGLGICYGRIGNLDAARKAMRAAVEASVASGRLKQSQSHLVLMSNLANITLKSKDYEDAARIQEEVLAIREKHFEADNPYIAESLESLAMCYEKLDRDDEAEKLYLRAIDIFESSAGAESLKTVGAWNNLADHYRGRKMFAAAAEISARVLVSIRKLFGESHRYTASAYENLGYAQFGSGDREGALVSLRGSIAASASELSDVFAFGTEQQRIGYLRSKNPWTLPASLGAAAELAELRLRQKGLVRDSLIEDRRLAANSKRPEVAAAIRSMEKAKQNLRGAVTGKAHTADVAAARSALHAAERELTDLTRRKSTARQALELEVDAVIAALPEHTALVDYTYYRRFDPGGRSQRRFDALVFRKGKPPVFVPCSSAEIVAPLVGTYLKCVAGATDDETTTETCRALFDALVAPLAPYLTGAERVVFSPDGILHRISFATLMPDGENHLTARYAVQYADSPRDLLVATGEAPAAPTIALVADPAYGNGDLSALPETRREAEAIAALATAKGWAATSLLAADATEPALRNIRSPTILHLATHGFLLDHDGPGSEEDAGMFRSALALGGASATLAAWARGESPQVGSDGVLTADEVAGLDLADSWLVTMSACDSGTGEVVSSEGVIGLRRGFALAGAENVVMTLWPVVSSTTSEFMADFYARALDQRNASRALHETQKQWLRRLLSEKGSMHAVMVAGPFILAQRARPGG